ncbi:MAG: lactamase [Armatimonadetes bacterium]|nr:MAG: lactamase [Armatimonadota bacterium]
MVVMDINWYGQACFRIKGKNATVVVDPFDPEFTGLKFPKDLEADIILSSHAHRDHNFIEGIKGNPLLISGSGEYEKVGVSVTGVGTFHDDSGGEQKGKNTIYHFLIDGINIVHLGDLGHVLTDEQVSGIDRTDILMIPVGNGGATIGSESAVKVVAQLEPALIIPMHYKLPDLKFDFEGVEPFLEEMGVKDINPVPKLVVTKDKLPAETTVILLSKS